MKNKLFIGGLAWATTEEGLKAALEKYGEIEDVRIITDRISGRSKGFGFVTFASEDDAKSAQEEMDGTALDGRNIHVDFARERQPRNDGYNRDDGPRY